MRLVTILSATLLIALVAAPAAGAADVERQEASDWIRVHADGDEVNSLTISRTDGTVTITDASADLEAKAGCEQVAPREVRCTLAAGGPRVEARLGGGDDEATVVSDVPVKLDGGGGDDILKAGASGDRLDGGDGNDTLDGGPGVDVYDGEGGDDSIAARDSLRETVVCGDGADGVVGDVEDEVAPDCETIDRSLAPPVIRPVEPTDLKVKDGPAPPAAVDPDPGADGPATPEPSNRPDTVGPPIPVPGQSVAAAAKAGTVLARVPGTDEFAPLDPSQPLPVGTVLDAREGVVSLTAAADQAGGTQTADFTGGKFRVGQDPAATMTTDLKLTGGGFKRKCSGARATGAVARAAGRRRRAVRKLWGSGKGRFRTRGRSSAATVRGTTWTVVDRCNGTLTRVTEGVVAVENLRTGRTKLVRAGERLFVRRPAKRRRR